MAESVDGRAPYPQDGGGGFGLAIGFADAVVDHHGDPATGDRTVAVHPDQGVGGVGEAGPVGPGEQDDRCGRIVRHGGQIGREPGRGIDDQDREGTPLPVSWAVLERPGAGPGAADRVVELRAGFGIDDSPAARGDRESAGVRLDEGDRPAQMRVGEFGEDCGDESAQRGPSGSAGQRADDDLVT